MKNNTMKRVLAATLSVLTVAGSMPANVAEVLVDRVSVVAGAEDAAKVGVYWSGTGVTGVTYDSESVNPKFVTNITAEPGKQITFTSETRLGFSADGVAFTEVVESGKDGAYTYTLTIPAKPLQVFDKTAVVRMQDSTATSGGAETLPSVYLSTITKDADGKFVTDGVTQITKDSVNKQGTSVTAFSKAPFDIKVADGKEPDSNVYSTVKSAVWDEKAGVYVVENYFLENDNVTFTTTAHAAKYEYTQDPVNKLFATDTAENGSVKDELAAAVTGTCMKEVPVEGEETGTDDLTGGDPVATEKKEVELENEGSYVYEKDGGVTVKLTHIDKLLGWGGSDDNLIAFDYEVTKDGQQFEFDGNPASGTVYKADYEATKLGDPIKDTGLTRNADGTIDMFKAVDQGHYEIKMTVWGTDNKAAAFNLTYKFDIISEELDASSFDVYTFSAEAIEHLDRIHEEEAIEVDESTKFDNQLDYFLYLISKGYIDAEDYSKYFRKAEWDAEKGIWNVVVPDKSNIVENEDGTKYYVPVEGYSEKLGTGAAIAATARMKALLATGKYADLKYGDTKNGYQIINEQAGTDLYTKYTLRVEIYNENYGGSPEKPLVIEIPWQLVEPKEAKDLSFKYYKNKNTSLDINFEAAKDEESIRAEIMKNVHCVDYDESKISFSYILESKYDSSLDLDQLDTLTPGVPTEDGRYRVYLNYDNELFDKKPDSTNPDEKYEFCFVNIDRSNFKFQFSEDVQTITYGDAVTPNEYEVLDYLGNTVNIAVDDAKFLYTVYPADSYGSDDELSISGDALFEDGETAGLLDAGTYYVKVSGKTKDGQKIGSGGYYVTVNRKELTADMIGFVNRPYNDGKTVYVWNPYTEDGQIIAKDTFKYIGTDGKETVKENEIAMAAVGGTYSATKPGSYNAQFAIRSVQEKIDEVTLRDIYDMFEIETETDGKGIITYYEVNASNEHLDTYFDFMERVGMEGTKLFEECYHKAVKLSVDRKTVTPPTYEEFAKTAVDAYVLADEVESPSVAHLGEEYFNENHESHQGHTAALWATAMAKKLRETHNLYESSNYVIPKRTLTAAWNIVRENDAAAPTLVMQDLGNGTKGKARLFDGGKIHVVAQRDAKTGDTVKSFGVIIDKEGKLAAPENIYNAKADTLAYAAATTALVLGNGYTASGQNLSGDEAKALKRGANIKPTTVDTGVWVRPYYVDMDGNAHYGDPEYFELADVTQRELQLRVPGWNGVGAVTRKTEKVDGKEVSTGDIIAAPQGADYDYMDNNLKKYNVGPVEEVLDGKLNRRVYYVAAVKNTLNEITDKEDPTNSRSKVEPKRFGIILDKSGVLPANDGKTDNAFDTAVKEMKVDDTRFRTTTTSNASQHGENAYGANITPKDVFTGVWVRPYVDFGNDLIVYGAPVYFDSFNDYFAALYGVTFYDTITDTKNKPETYKAITVNAEKVETADKMAFYYMPKFGLDQTMYDEAHGTWYNNDNKLTYAEAGVVVDRTNSVENTDTLSLADVDKVNVVSGKRTKDVIESTVNNTHPGVYGATIKKTDSIVNVRPFIKIDNDLTLYGPVKSVTFEDAQKGVDTWAPNIWA